MDIAQKIRELRAERKQARADLKSIIAKAEAENRSVNVDEKRRFEEITTRAEKINDELDTLEDERLGASEPVEPRSTNNFMQALEAGVASGRITRTDAGVQTASLIAGKVGLSKEQRMVDFVPGGKLGNGQRMSLGKIVRGLALGNWQGADEEFRAMSGGVATAGGVMLPLPVSTEVIDLVRNRSAVVAAGARVLPMTSSTLKVPRVTADPSIGWRAENAAFATSDPTFEPVTMTAKTLGGIVKTSIELTEDVQHLDEVVYNMLASAIAVELDRACLRGSGSGSEPTGIKNTTGIQTMTAIGDVESYTPFVRGVQKVMQVNGVPNSIVCAPRTIGDLAAAVDTTGQSLNPPKILDALSWQVSNNIPTNLGTGTDESEAYVGDFSQLWIGMRTNIYFEVSRVSDSAFGSGQVHIRAYLRGDAMVARPNHFVLMSGLTSPA